MRRVLGILIVAVGCGRSPQPAAAGADAASPASQATGALIVHVDGRPKLVCTATLIAPRVVLTAAHCVTPWPAGALEFTRAADPGALSRGADSDSAVHVRRVFVNPSYDLLAFGPMHDIALAELERPPVSEDGEPVQKVAIGSSPIRRGEEIDLVGYGRADGGTSPAGRRTVTEARVTGLGKSELTVGGPGQPQACVGDSGGPGFVREADGALRLVAVTSRSAKSSSECVDGSLHTRVDAHTEWLTATLASIADP